jgi:hypothetical protein
MEPTMPQNKPMTPEHATCGGCRWWYAGLCSNYESCLDHERWEMSPAQLVRSTLEAAANSFCKHKCAWPPNEWEHPDECECADRAAILAPLTKPDEIESATLDEVNHRRGFDK